MYSYKYLKMRFSSDKKDVMKMSENGWKALKYILDIITSYNNSSLKKKLGAVNPKLAGFFTVISSCIGIFLMWS